MGTDRSSPLVPAAEGITAPFISQANHLKPEGSFYNKNNNEKRADGLAYRATDEEIIDDEQQKSSASLYPLPEEKGNYGQSIKFNVKRERIIKMFGFLKKKNEKVQYLLRVAAILHENTGPTLPLKNAYNLAEECLNELKGNISSGMFHDGPNPKENIMAYYSMCSMVNEMSAADDKMTVLKLSVMTRALKDELGAFENMTSLEKGIWQFGEQVLAEMLE